MSKDLNLCQFIGRLGQDPETKQLNNGDAVVNLSIACGDDYKNKQTGEKVENTNWIKVVAFRRLAEVISQYVRKGEQIYISGKQVTRKWQDKDGNDRYTTEIVANEMQMLGSKGDRQPSNTPQPEPQGQPQTATGAYDDFDDDIPF